MDEVILQIETDKVTIDVKSPEAGVVAGVLVAEEDTVVVGQQGALGTPGDSQNYKTRPIQVTIPPSDTSPRPLDTGKLST